VGQLPEWRLAGGHPTHGLLLSVENDHHGARDDDIFRVVVNAFKRETL
jgi:hypothetical protein